MEKRELPPYSAVEPASSFWPRPRSFRRRGRLVRLVGVACLLFLALCQWTQLNRAPSSGPAGGPLLSAEQLAEDLATCAALHAKPQDATGAGRVRNARTAASQPPTLIRNATVWVGEAEPGTAPADARAGLGYRWAAADVFVVNGLIERVKIRSSSVDGIDPASVPSTTSVWDARGRQLTAGIIDMHSHGGVSSLPSLWGWEDTNEMSEDTTPYVRSIDGLQPLDHQLRVIKSGGVTTSLVLPGSGNNIGGEAYVIKHAVGVHDGRPELSIASLLAAPDAPQLRYIKMACGENAKRVYGRAGQSGPYSRLGESWEFRHAFEQAAALVQAQDDWCATAADSQTPPTTYLPKDLKWATLAAVLRGQVQVHTHCYTIPDLEAFVDHTNEFRFPVRAFHHAHQTFLVPEVLKRAWGADVYGPPASAMFADNMYYKAESYVASEFAGKRLWASGLTPIYVSDNPVLNAQHVLFEAAKAYHYGLPYHAALAAVTSAPAERLGLGHRLGRIKPGFDADIVVWDSDPLSVGAAPVQVWIDGVAQFDDPVELDKPVRAPLVPADAALAHKEEVAEGVETTGDVVFTGVAQLLLPGFEEASAALAREQGGRVNVAVSGGRVVCVGVCEAEVRSAQDGATDSRLVRLENGYLTAALAAFGSHIGLVEIESEADTEDGSNSSGDVFSRALDGLALDGKKLHVAHRYGVTRAITAPSLRRGFTHHGTSAGFLTAATTRLDAGAVFAPDAAVHYTLTYAAKKGSTPSLSSAVGALRKKLLAAVETKTDTKSDPFSEVAYLSKVVAGTLPLAITAHSADTIAAVLGVKADVEAVSGTPLRLVVLGGAEAYLVADALAAADVGVVLAPLQSYAVAWEERRALTGAPLTNGTAVDVLVDAGVTVAVGLEEDWLVRDLALLAGIAHANGGGRLSERAAWDLVSANVFRLLGLAQPAQAAGRDGHFVVYEGSPLAIGSAIKAVAGGVGTTLLF